MKKKSKNIGSSDLFAHILMVFVVSFSGSAFASLKRAADFSKDLSKVSSNFTSSLNDIARPELDGEYLRLVRDYLKKHPKAEQFSRSDFKGTAIASNPLVLERTLALLQSVDGAFRTGDFNDLGQLLAKEARLPREQQVVAILSQNAKIASAMNFGAMNKIEKLEELYVAKLSEIQTTVGINVFSAQSIQGMNGHWTSALFPICVVGVYCAYQYATSHATGTWSSVEFYPGGAIVTASEGVTEALSTIPLVSAYLGGNILPSAAIEKALDLMSLIAVPIFAAEAALPSDDSLDDGLGEGGSDLPPMILGDGENVPTGQTISVRDILNHVKDHLGGGPATTLPASSKDTATKGTTGIGIISTIADAITEAGARYTDHPTRNDGGAGEEKSGNDGPIRARLFREALGGEQLIPLITATLTPAEIAKPVRANTTFAKTANR